MKWLFFLLVASNVLLFIWGGQREEERAVKVPQLLANVGELRLISEIGVELAQAKDKDAQIKAITLETDIKMAQEPSAVVEKEAPAKDEEPGLPFKAEAEMAINTSSQQGEPVVLETQLEVSDQTAEEVVTASGQALIEEPNKALNQEPFTDLICGTIGSFDRGVLARAVIENLTQQGITATLRKESIQKPIGYWVMIPPLDNQEDAANLVQLLRQRGVKDIRRFVKGDQKNGISLGVFSRRENAQKRRNEIARGGLTIEITPRYITAPIYWVEYRGDKGTVIEAYSQLRVEYNDVKNSQDPC